MPSGGDPAIDGSTAAVIGDDLVAVAVDGTRLAQALADALRESGGWIECVAGIASCVARFDNAAVTPGAALGRLVAAALGVTPPRDEDAELVEIPVCYGGTFGPDLGDLCEQLDMAPDELIALHTGREYRVDMLGFTPGFAFIGGLDGALNVPRRKEPRVRLAAGSIGIAGGRTGIYTLPGPGGWSIIGRTPMRLFDATAGEPFRLRAGMRVRFSAIDRDAFDAAAER